MPPASSRRSRPAAHTALESGAHNWLIDAGLATPPLRALAQSIYFHRRGLLSPRVWSDLLRTDERRRAG